MGVACRTRHKYVRAIPPLGLLAPLGTPSYVMLSSPRRPSPYRLDLAQPPCMYASETETSVVWRQRASTSPAGCVQRQWSKSAEPRGCVYRMQTFERACKSTSIRSSIGMYSWATSVCDLFRCGKNSSYSTKRERERESASQKKRWLANESSACVKSLVNNNTQLYILREIIVISERCCVRSDSRVIIHRKSVILPETGISCEDRKGFEPSTWMGREAERSRTSKARCSLWWSMSLT